MEADYVFKIGSTHTICQDYCLAGSAEDVSYALLSDGCSGKADPEHPGSPYTDFGSRFLVMAAKQQIKNLAKGNLDRNTLVWRAHNTAESAGLSNTIEALDGTLLMAATSKDNPYIYVARMGDGVVVIRGRDGRVRSSSLEYEGNMPFYLSYRLSERREEAYHSMCTKVTEHTAVRDPLTKAWDKTTLEFTPMIDGDLLVIPKIDVDLVLLLSDGAESFLKGHDQVELSDVLDQVLDIKGYAGQFLKRRCNKFLTNFCVTNNWQHVDDFSVAGLYFP